MRLEHGFHLADGDVLTTADDDVLQTSGDREPAVFDRADVTGVEPSVAVERVVPADVGDEQLGAPDEQLAGTGLDPQLHRARRASAGRARSFGIVARL